MEWHHATARIETTSAKFLGEPRQGQVKASAVNVASAPAGPTIQADQTQGSAWPK